MKKISLILIHTIFFITTVAQAKIWRVNNNPGVSADFANFVTAVNTASVLAGDTLHLEPSPTAYAAHGSFNKRLVVLGVGYFLDPAVAAEPANPGLQATIHSSRISGSMGLWAGASGSVFSGLRFEGGVTFSGGAVTVSEIRFERCHFGNVVTFSNASYSNISMRQCYFGGLGASINNATENTLSNFICENSIFNGPNAQVTVSGLTGSGNVFRNNSFFSTNRLPIISNCYVANNIFHMQTAGTPAALVNCTVKNNLFSNNQSLPETATNNVINVSMSNVFVGGTGSLDSRFALKTDNPATNPAIGGGLTVGDVVSPDCGAFGGPVPYRLSGIPAIPSIYSVNVPISVPAGSTVLNGTFSTRNNN